MLIWRTELPDYARMHDQDELARDPDNGASLWLGKGDSQGGAHTFVLKVPAKGVDYLYERFKAVSWPEALTTANVHLREYEQGKRKFAPHRERTTRRKVEVEA